jgi:tetratricopeptide (TPR) repeat protein
MMCFKITGVAGLVSLVIFSGALRADDPVPDSAMVRRQIDELINNPPNHKCTLGTLRGAMNLSISYGAPAWNAADHDACAKFYIQTGQSLCKSSPTADSASETARPILDDLKSALKRVDGSDDTDANAWTMRYVFDKTEIGAQTEADRGVRLVGLGEETFARGQYDDAANAFGSATQSLRELDGESLDLIPPLCRYAPLALSDALFAQKKYKESAAAIHEGLHFFPSIGDEKLDLRKHFSDPALYRILSDDLKDAATAHPDDAGLQFLMGYHLYFTGHHEDAKPYFEKSAKLDPNDAGAKQMLDEYNPDHKKPKVTEHSGVGV